MEQESHGKHCWVVHWCFVQHSLTDGNEKFFLWQLVRGTACAKWPLLMSGASWGGGRGATGLLTPTKVLARGWDALEDDDDDAEHQPYTPLSRNVCLFCVSIPSMEVELFHFWKLSCMSVKPPSKTGRPKVWAMLPPHSNVLLWH